MVQKSTWMSIARRLLCGDNQEYGLIEELPAKWYQIIRISYSQWYDSEKRYQWFTLFRDGLPVECRSDYPWNW